MKRLAAALVFTVALSAAAEDAVIGLGASQNCGDWTKERSLPRGPNGNAGMRDLMLVSWIQGYASGLNMGLAKFEAKGMVDFVGFNAIMSWMDSYCRSNPFDTLFMASSTMVDQLRSRQGKK